MRLSKEVVYDSARPRLAIWEDAVELFRYRDLLWGLVQRDLTVRYKRSVLGFLWTMLNPLLTMLVLTIVFSNFFRFAVEQYAIYLLAALLLWNFFAQSTTQAIHNLVWAGSLIQRIYVPKSLFVIEAVLFHLVNLLLALIPLALIMLLARHPFSLALLFLPVPIFLTALFAFGIGLIISALAVFFADVIDIYQVVLTILLYLTPIFYPLEIVPKEFLPIFQLNPMISFVQIFRIPIHQGHWPETYLVAQAALMAVGTLGLGWWFFSRRAREFAYRV